MSHIAFSAKKDCYNPWESYGEICVHCRCCGKPRPERTRARLRLWGRQMADCRPKTGEGPYYRHNRSYVLRRQKYYQARVRAMKGAENA